MRNNRSRASWAGIGTAATGSAAGAIELQAERLLSGRSCRSLVCCCRKIVLTLALALAARRGRRCPVGAHSGAVGR